MAVTFVAVAVVSTLLFGAPTWQLVQQDRQLDEPRRRGLAEAVADTAAVALKTALDRLGAPPLAGVSVVTIEPAGTSITPVGSLPLVPTRGRLPEADWATFAAASAFESAQPPDLAIAVAAYRDLSTAGRAERRATALAHLAPLLARGGDTSRALAAYEQLDGFDGVAVPSSAATRRRPRNGSVPLPTGQRLAPGHAADGGAPRRACGAGTRCTNVAHGGRRALRSGRASATG